MLRRFSRVVPVLVLALQGCSGESGEAGEAPETPTPDLPEDVLTRLQALSPTTLPEPPSDPTNAYAERADAVELGKRLFFDPGFSGPLLDDDNDGAPETLGLQGEAGKVSCAS